MRLMISAFLLAGCGVHITSDPIQVNHSIELNDELIREYCARQCYGETACMEECRNKLTTELLEAILNGGETK